MQLYQSKFISTRMTVEPQVTCITHIARAGGGMVTGMDTVLVLNEQMDTFITMLSAIRNARLLELEVECLYSYEHNGSTHILVHRKDTQDYVVVYVVPSVPIAHYVHGGAYVVTSILKDIEVQEFPAAIG